MFLIFLIILSFTSCHAATGEEIINIFSGADSQPPRLQEVRTTGRNTAQLSFNEEVFIKVDSFSPHQATSSGSVVNIYLQENISASEMITISGRVTDRVGNSSAVKVPIWGLNENPASLLINEITTRGTERNPDRTELLVTSSGNTGGITLSDGALSTFNGRFTLPSLEVSEGDLLVIWWTFAPPSTEGEALHFDASGISNPPGVNGVQTLTSSPALGAEVLDCVVYSNPAGTAFEGFGSKTTLLMVEELVSNGWWQGEGVINSTIGVDSTKATATRSISRKIGENDTNTKEDWFITETGGASFGLPNTSTPYSN